MSKLVPIAAQMGSWAALAETPKLTTPATEREKERARIKNNAGESKRMPPEVFAMLTEKAFCHIAEHPPGDISRRVLKVSLGTVAPVNAAFNRAIAEGLIDVIDQGYSGLRKRFVRNEKQWTQLKTVSASPWANTDASIEQGLQLP